jgi:K+-transporting ATPase KdpF subunit
MPTPANVCESIAMFIDYLLGGIVTAGLLGYLVFALVRPERF